MDTYKDSFDEEQFEISCAKSISPKLMKELNFNQNSKLRRQKRRIKLKFQNEIKTDPLITYQLIRNHKVQLDKHKIIETLINMKKIRKQIDINGNKVIGKLQKDGLNGKTEVSFKTGAKFKGKFINGKINNGKFQFSNGYVFQGGFMNNKFFGSGILNFPDGKSIEGTWNGEQIVGNGQIKYPTGDIYYGQISNLKKHGFGYLFKVDGSKFIGQFKEGKICGKGSYYKNELLVSQGYWQKGLLVESQAFQTYTFKAIISNNQDRQGQFQPQKIYDEQFTLGIENTQQKNRKTRDKTMKKQSVTFQDQIQNSWNQSWQNLV